MKWFYMTFCDVTLGGPPGDEERESGLSYRARSRPSSRRLPPTAFRYICAAALSLAGGEGGRAGSAGRCCTVDSAAL